MKKQFTLALAAALSLSVAGASLAAVTNPFNDVPANHWAYDALAQLSQEGVISGYGDGTFRGDRTLTRYEMAAMIAKITNTPDKTAPLLKRLQSEFANELYNLGVRVDKLEKNASTIKFTGDGVIAYETNMVIGADAAREKSAHGDNSQFKQEINLNMEAEVNEHLTFYGRITAENISNAYSPDDSIKTSETGNLSLDLAELKWENKNFAVSAGRLNPFLGQGLIWGGDNPADGLLIGYDLGRAQLSAGYLDLAPTADVGPSVNVFAANLNVAVTDKINLSAAYLNAINRHWLSDPTDPDDPYPDGYAFKQIAFGGNAKLGENFTLTGEYVRNNAAPAGEGVQKSGVWGRLQWKEIDESEKGTYSIYVDYLKLGNWAIDSSTFGHDLNVAGGNGIGGDGAKGWGVGFQYVFAKNANLELNYYDLKSYNGDAKYKKSYSVTTNFYF